MSGVEKVVIEEKITRTSDVVPTLFVGLGGCGIRIIRRIRGHLAARPDYKDRFQDLTRFAAVDTNINDLEEARADADEIFLISDFEKEAYAALASGKSFLDEDEHFTQWVPKDYRFRAGDTAGAGQIRIESRLGCYYTMRHGDFLTKMRRLVDELKDHDNGYRRLEPREVRVVVAFSVAGGTGSGAHLAMAYVLRDMVAEVGKPTLIGTAVMPTVFDQKVGVNKDGTNANGYAALKEIEHLMRLGAPASDFYPRDGVRFHYNGGDQSKTTVRTKPFDFLYIIDKPEPFTVADVEGAAGDGLYLQLFSGLFKEQAGDYDNYTQHQRVLVPHDFADKGIQGFTSFYATFGSAVMVVPSDGIIEYCSRIAALSLMRDNFLRTPPASPVYSSVRSDDRYYTVRGERGDDVKESEFDRRGKEAESLRDKLFIKRVRLLADAELKAMPRPSPDYCDVFRHGHDEDAAPTDLGTVVSAPGTFGEPRTYSLEELLQHRIYQAVMRSLRPERAGQADSIRLLKKAVDAGNKAIAKVKTADLEAAGGTVRTEGILRRREVYDNLSTTAQASASQAVERARQAMLQVFEAGDQTALGFAALRGASFLRGGSATLTQRRYAALMLLQDLPFDLVQHAGDPGSFQSGAVSEESSQDPEAAFGDAYKSVQDYVTRFAHYQVHDCLAELKGHVTSFCDVLRAVDVRFDKFATDAAKGAEERRLDGGKRASAYILDGETLTIETGRRMWDFFYVDRVMESIRGRREAEFQREIDLKLGIGENRRHVSPDVLDDLFKTFVKQTRKDVAPIVVGDPAIGRKPLGIREAIQLEITYRELYMSRRERIDAATVPLDEVKVAVMQHRELHQKRSGDEPDDPARVSQRQDYVTDKFRRLVQEKADYLCLYDESRDQQGGVRPDKFDAVAMTKDLAKRDPDLVKAIKAASGKEPKIVDEGWTDEQAIVFYKAILNIPLYVFGRMNAMKDHYHRFRGQRYRSKVLHVDRNWEDDLPDLDPEAAFERYQTQVLDQNVLWFAALHVDRGPNQRRLVRLHKDRYEVLLPTEADRPDEPEEWLPLGATIAEAARNLPQVLEKSKQRNLRYFTYKTQLMRGLLPRDLVEAFELAKAWRSLYEVLCTKLVDKGGANERKLQDIDQSLHAMLRAAEGLARRVNDQHLMAGLFGDAVQVGDLGLTTATAKTAMEQSAAVAQGFVEYASKILRPNDEVDGALDADFFGYGDGGVLWGPMSAQDLKERLDILAGKTSGKSAVEAS